MKVSTLSIVCGTDACNASCPYCISKITGTEDIPKTPAINYTRLKKACQLAENSGATTVLLTGKGEPTLYMDQILEFLSSLQNFNIPIVELQTNGIILSKNQDTYLRELRRGRLDTICLSIVHWVRSFLNAKAFWPLGNIDTDIPAAISLDACWAVLSHIIVEF